MRLKDILAALESFYRHRAELEALEYVASLQDMAREGGADDVVLLAHFTGRLSFGRCVTAATSPSSRRKAQAGCIQAAR
jgi:hypothetical protein